MPTSLSRINAAMQLSSQLSNLTTIGGPAEASLSMQYTHQFKTGTGADQADRFWYNTYNIADATSRTIDLLDFNTEDVGAGMGNDHLGIPITLAEVVAIMVKVDAASVGNLLLGNEGSADEWVSPFNNVAGAELGPFPADSSVYLTKPSDPAFLVNATNRLLKFAAVGGDITITIAIMGRST